MSPERTTLPGLAFCTSCLDAGLEPKERFVFPKVIVKARLKWGLALLVAMGIAFVFPFFVLEAPWNFLIGTASLLVVELLFVVATYSRIQHAGLDLWKRDVQTKLAIPEELALPFVLYIPRKPRLWDLSVAFDACLLAETDTGFVLIGEKTRVVLRFGAATGISTYWLFMNPPRTSVRVDMPDGPRFISFVEKNTFRDNRALAVACSRRAEAKRRALPR